MPLVEGMWSELFDKPFVPDDVHEGGGVAVSAPRLRMDLMPEPE